MVPINYLAVLLCAIAAMVLGFLWYGPLFGKKWSELMGWGTMTPEKMAEKQKAARPAYAITFVGALLMAYILANAITLFLVAYPMEGADAFATGPLFGFWAWLGFVVPVTIGQVLWDGKPWKLWLINVGYFLAQMLLMGAILGYWM